MVGADQLLHSRRVQRGRLLRGEVVVHLSETSHQQKKTQYKIRQNVEHSSEIFETFRMQTDVVENGLPQQCRGFFRF